MSSHTVHCIRTYSKYHNDVRRVTQLEKLLWDLFIEKDFGMDVCGVCVVFILFAEVMPLEYHKH